VLVAVVAASSGCNNPTSSTSPQSPTGGTVGAADRGPRVIDMTRGPRGSANFDVDSCAERLHTIEGQIILYYAVNHRLPDQLSELSAYADVGSVPDYTCPVSHQTYVYVPTGLVLGSDPQHLILYDATPAHDSERGPMRWGILFSPAKGREPVATHVIPIPENTLAGFVPAPPMRLPTSMPARRDQ
jgi:hypothetical protein